LSRLDTQAFGDLAYGLIDRSSRLGSDGDQRRVALGHNVLLRHELEEGDALLDDVGVEEDLVDDGFDGADRQELFQVVDRVAGRLLAFCERSGLSKPRMSMHYRSWPSFQVRTLFEAR